MIHGEEERAFKTSLNLLKFRDRSIAELERHLLKKGFGDGVVNKVISELKQKDYLNDKTFTQVWIRDRVQKAYGPRRIKQELLQKGVEKELIEKELKKFFPANSRWEEESLLKTAEKKLQSYQRLESPVVFRRLGQYLLRRGFSPSLVSKTLPKLLQNKFRKPDGL